MYFAGEWVNLVVYARMPHGLAYLDDHVGLALKSFHSRKEYHQKDGRHHKLIQRHLDKHSAHAAKCIITMQSACLPNGT